MLRSFSERVLEDDGASSSEDDENGPKLRVPLRDRPVVGSKMLNVSAPGPVPERWEEPDTTTFMVRGGSYMKDKVKIRSAPGIYAAVGAEIFTGSEKIDHVMRRLRLPPPNIALGGPLVPPPGSPAAQMQGHLPRFLVINIQVGSYEPPMFNNPGNGPGLSVVLVHELVTNGTRITSQARPLVERFFRNEADPVTGEPTRERLKYIPRICNCDQACAEAGLSRAEKSFMKAYDGKPVMTRPQHRFFRGPDEMGSGRDYLEIDIDSHGYSYVARKGVYSYRNVLDRLILDSGFVLQGNVAEELPEQILCACRVHRMDFHKERPAPQPMEVPLSPSGKRRTSDGGAADPQLASGAAGSPPRNAPA
jgi:hypothetical protein